MTSVRASATIPNQTATRPRALLAVSEFLLAPATGVLILAIAVLLLMTPAWMHLALDLSGGSYAQPTAELAHQLSDATVKELFVGPGTFQQFTADEAAHMRDVRVVLWAFLGAAAASLVLVTWRIWRNGGAAKTWRLVARGGLMVAALVVLAGIFAGLAFGLAFELFHRIFFPGGNWAFSSDSLLIRLYPYEFWQLTAGVLGILAATAGVTIWLIAGRRAKALDQE